MQRRAPFLERWRGQSLHFEAPARTAFKDHGPYLRSKLLGSGKEKINLIFTKKKVSPEQTIITLL